MQAFKEEINCLMKSNNPTSVRVKQFGLFLDDGILKCYGCINNSTLPIGSKRPILLPPKHPFVDLLIRHFHTQLVKHNGVSDTLTSLRERYWILRGRQTVKRVIRSCTICLRHEGLPYSYPTPPHLPGDRVSDDPPFAHTGIDFAGPLIVYQCEGDGNQLKAYICLFTCASTRAVHLELTGSLNVEHFLLALRRFVGRRGLPATIWSDNAKTFKLTAKELQRIMSSPKIHRYLSNIRVEWKFIIDRAPWWGGFWERMVKSVKRCLRKCIGWTSLNFDELNTLVVEVESVINSWPLTYVHDDAEGISYALCPSDLINGRRISATPNEAYYEVISTHETLTRRMKHHQMLIRQFTRRWRREYLLNLREKHLIKSKPQDNRPIKVGDVVILKNDFTKRAFWKLATVKSLISSKDRINKAATVNPLTRISQYTGILRYCL